jgi:hypothetical protein
MDNSEVRANDYFSFSKNKSGIKIKTPLDSNFDTGCSQGFFHSWFALEKRKNNNHCLAGGP